MGRHDRPHACGGISQESIERHLTAGQVHVDGVRVTDTYARAPNPAVIVLMLN
jgi:hypothetical protein